ncbi:hypothetical protein [Desulfotruncus alcoholivorax]|uniref:hypothetical protein n=1 Tax=Desulfotruncus alcoholivorax TaxID=265477 RepID=UPI00041DE321|nr:hypothetical protein [Desulfotruncus alcoholivorax]
MNIRKKYLFIIVILLVLIAAAYTMAATGTKKESTRPIVKKQLTGEFLSWEEVDVLFPKFAKATVIDQKTGLSFRVQRRAGQYHADVQPLTANDTYIMKTIYSGKWSWNRKPIVVQLDSGRRIAASMHGMPHGAGAIKGNNFNGHFCIHFRDSKTHASGSVNYAHQIMVWIAANNLDKQIQILTPEQAIEVFLAAVDQSKPEIAKKIIDPESYSASELLTGLNGLKMIKIIKITSTEEKNTYKVDTGVVYQDSEKVYQKNLLLQLKYKKDQGWKINPETALPILDKETWDSVLPWGKEMLLENED